MTFEPGCRNNWHSHTGGQLLLVTAGRGYYQEKGEPARELRPGDVVEIPADVVHWHGAAPDSWFSHLAVECNPAANVNTWLEPVGDAEYEAATAMSWCRPGLSAAAVKNAEMWFPGEAPAFVKTDPELAEVFGNFAFDEVQRYGKLDVKTRILVTMASSLAQQAAATYEMTLRAALANGVAPVAVREVLYQAVPYVGMAKVVDYIALTNDFFRKTRSGLSKSQISGTKKQVSPPKTLAYSLTVRIFRATKPPLSYRRPHSGSGYAAPPVYRAPKGSRWVPYRHGSCP